MRLIFHSLVLGLWTLQLFLVTQCDGHVNRSKSPRDLYYDDKMAVLSHSIHRIIKRGVAWSFHGTKPGPEFILPSCPCQRESRKCQEYDYCYCQLGYPPPMSQVTGEPFLQSYYKQCSISNSSDSKLPNFNGLPFLEKYFVAFPSPFWDCQEKDFLPNQVHLFYPYLCLRRKLIPLKGTFYGMPQSLTSGGTQFETRKYFASLKTPTYTWPVPDNKDFQLSKALTGNPSTPTTNSGQRSTRVEHGNGNGHVFDISGGRGCTADLGVYRRGISASYQCDVHIYPTTPESTCDSIGSIVEDASRHLLNLQLKPIFHMDPNGTITYTPPNSTRRAGGVNPKVTKVNVTTANVRLEDPYSGIHVICRDQLLGFHMTFIHRHFELVAVKLEKRRGDMKRDKSSVFPIEISFQSLDADPKYFSKLSRFWYEFYHGECRDQFCWRDLLQFPIEDGNFGGNVDGMVVLLAIPLFGLVLANLLFHGDILDLN